MKEVKLVILRGGRIKILAEGANGKGTADFTMSLSQDLGFIVERHRGPAYTETHQHNEQLIKN